MTTSARPAPRPQAGVLSFGTTDHCYLELDLREGARLDEVVDLLGPEGDVTTVGAGCTVVVGFRPELWRDLAPGTAPEQVHGFEAPVVGDDGFTMPATQHDLVVWVAGGQRDVVFDAATAVVDALAPHARVATDVVGWVYRRDRDLTGFVDGTENPSPDEAPDAAVVADGPGAGGSVLLLQQWPHQPAWRDLSDDEQSAVIGRDKATDDELDPKPETAHAARTDQEDFGHILRRNTAYGSVTDHGTMFVGFAADQGVLERMLRSMAGADGRPRDALTRYTHAATGAYYWVPPQTDLVAERRD